MERGSISLNWANFAIVCPVSNGEYVGENLVGLLIEASVRPQLTKKLAEVERKGPMRT